MPGARKVAQAAALRREITEDGVGQLMRRLADLARESGNPAQADLSVYMAAAELHVQLLAHLARPVAPGSRARGQQLSVLADTAKTVRGLLARLSLDAPPEMAEALAEVDGRVTAFWGASQGPS